MMYHFRILYLSYPQFGTLNHEGPPAPAIFIMGDDIPICQIQANYAQRITTVNPTNKTTAAQWKGRHYDTKLSLARWLFHSPYLNICNHKTLI